MKIIAALLQSVRNTTSVQVIRQRCLLLVLVVLFFSCKDKHEEFTEVYVKRYVGDYTGEAQDNYMDYKHTFTRKDTIYKDVQVAIVRSTDNSEQVVVTVLLPIGSRRQYNEVQVIGNKLFYLMTARGCGCTHSLSGEIKNNVLELSLYDYESTMIDSRISVQATKK
ncbi:hypothetical protein [Pontibacter liquoris]|uniref:hypothetical protein n=1 Tax=Pontibacter liquoris TaxID=2905677 RepID=UPI001FA7C695|nr:hypothetical protein [Pontibacter liquoris]